MTELIIKPYNKEKVMAKKPTLIGCVSGIRFYEHPTFGDEYPLIASRGSEFGLTELWEVPTLEELVDYELI